MDKAVGGSFAYAEWGHVARLLEAGWAVGERRVVTNGVGLMQSRAVLPAAAKWQRCRRGLGERCKMRQWVRE